MTHHSDDALGPLGYLVLEIEGEDPDGLAELLTLTERDDVRILDVEAVTKDADGTVHLVNVDEVPALAHIAGAYAGLLDLDDVTDVGGLLDPGTTAAVVVYESVWALRLPGFHLVGAGPVSPTDVESALGPDES